MNNQDLKEQERYKILDYPKGKNEYYEIKKNIPLQNSLDGFFGIKKVKEDLISEKDN